LVRGLKINEHPESALVVRLAQVSGDQGRRWWGILPVVHQPDGLANHPGELGEVIGSGVDARQIREYCAVSTAVPLVHVHGILG